MRVSGRLSAFLLFAGISLVALFVAGFLDWITSSLFLILESLAASLRRLWGNRSPRQHVAKRGQRTVGLPLSSSLRHRPLARRKNRPRQKLASDLAAQESLTSKPQSRLLLPLSHDQPELVTFALSECRNRNAELLLLFLRPMAFIPMGPNPLPGSDDDLEANELRARVITEARAARVTIRDFYEVTSDRAATIIEVARKLEVDVLILGTTRRGWIWKAFAGDLTRSILSHLPERASLVIHAV